MNKLLEVLQVHDARVGLKINVENTKSLMLGTSTDEKVTLGNENIDQVDSFLDSIKMVMGFSSQLKKSLEE